jgi:hypothetical protein
MVNHPAVVAEAARDAATTPAQRVERDGLSIVTCRRTRVYVDRAAWEMLPEHGVLLIQVRPRDGTPPFDLAMTPAELEQAFGEVRDSESWETVRHYSFPSPPEACAS